MSTQNRTGGGGRNQKKSNPSGGGGGGSNSGGGGGDGNKKTDVKAEKEKSQLKPTAEQIRIAQITDCRSEDPKMREKVATLIEMTQRSEEEVCCALYECEHNLEKAVVFLLETLPVGAFETSSKKKKNRSANATTDGGGTPDGGEWTETNNNNNNNADNRERSRNRAATTRTGRGGSDSRGWRGREARENERNASDSKGNEGWRGGRGRGGSRGGYGGRGGRGGRAGPRGMGSRDPTRNYSRQPQDAQEVDTWDNAIATNAEQMKQPDAFSDAWGDWDNEEYVGSLKDTKVFTPSNLQTQNLSAPPGLEQHMVNAAHMTADDLVQQYSTSYSTTVVSSTTTAAAAAAAAAAAGVANSSIQFADIHSANANQHLRLGGGLDAQQMNASSTLSAEQSQYFNSLPSQGSNPQTNVNSYQNTSVQYPTSYVTNTVFGDQSVTSQPSVRRARAKVPPPSKIPATAVEMPGDTLNNIGYLDVQFGGLDFATDESFDTLTEKFNAATTIDNNNQQQQNPIQSQDVIVAGDFQTKSSTQQQSSSLPSALQTSQMISNSDTLSSTQTDPLSSSYSQQRQSVGNVTQQGTGVGGGGGGVGVGVGNSINTSSGSNALDQLTKTDPYNHQSNTSNTTGGYQNSYNTNSSTNKSTSYQTSGSTQGYNSANYTTNAQVVSSGNSYQPSSNSAYNTYNQNSVNTYQQQQSSNASATNSSNSASGGGGNTANSSNVNQNIPVGGGSSNAVNNAGSNTNAGYLSNQYQSNQTTSAFPSQQSGGGSSGGGGGGSGGGYQNSQSVYGTTGLANNTGFSGSTNTSSSQYSNFSSSKLKESSTSANTHFDSVSSVTSSSGAASSTVSSVSSSSVTTNSMSSPSLGLANTKVTNSTAKSQAGILPNIQMVSQYIQTGLPYYQQPALYSYEDIQMMQQRMPHVTQYYDINYPPTSLGAAPGVRDANLGSVAYSTMTDGRFTRTDNNSSPVSSTMSQQAGSSGPMLNVPYAYFYGGNMMPGGFQYGTPAIYPQQMPTANATSGGQFPKPSYNSGYGSTSYDALGQATQDYSKGAYAGSGVVNQQSKAQTVTNPPQAASASDITSSMYGKSHVALNKVNSYEKQSFHSGTPPPFNLSGTQNAAATSAQTYGMYIQPMPAAHHNMNIHPTIHQDTSSTGQRQQTSGQKAGTKQGYSPSYWAAPN